MPKPSSARPALPRSCALPTLGARLIAGFEAEPAASDVLRRVLCNDAIPDHLPNTSLEWMRDFSSLVALNKELCRQQSGEGSLLALPVALGPLLAWASQQSWEQDVAWEHFLVAWPHALCRQGPVKSAAAVEHALSVFRPHMHALAPDRRDSVFNAWLRASPIWDDPRWAPDARPYMARSWMVLAEMAQSLPVSLPARAAMARWTARVKKSLYDMDTWHQTAMIEAFLSSSLPAEIKLAAAGAGDPESLDTPVVAAALKPLMPVKESARVALLPWCSPVGAAMPSGSRRTYMVHEAREVNSAMVQTYCPVLHGLLDCVVERNDWAYKNRILALAKEMSSATAQDSFDLPMDWEAA